MPVNNIFVQIRAGQVFELAKGQVPGTQSKSYRRDSFD